MGSETVGGFEAAAEGAGVFEAALPGDVLYGEGSSGQFFGGMVEADLRQVAMRGGVEGSLKLADELWNGEAGGFADGFEGDRFGITGVKKIFCDTEFFEDIRSGGGFEGVYPCGAGEFGTVSADEVVQKEDEVFIGGIVVVTIGVEVGDEGIEVVVENRIDVVQGLKEFRLSVLKIVG